jgi:hypothetical protein
VRRWTDTGWLEANRDRAIVEGLAMMTFNPSIGRVLAVGSGLKFKGIAWRGLRILTRLKDRATFDRFHNRLVLRTKRNLKRTGRRRKLSYGQAQKAVNVFLKVYVDWAKLPNRKTATRLGKFLHVPLDSVVMGHVRREYHERHGQIVAPAYRAAEERPSDLRLVIINRQMYRAWQRLFREIRPRRPIDLDVLWSLAPRDGSRRAQVSETSR